MKLKVTAALVIGLSTFCNCTTADDEADLQFQRKVDSTGSVSIDSAYKIIRAKCDSNLQYKLPLLVDSLLATDSIH